MYETPVGFNPYVTYAHVVQSDVRRQCLRRDLQGAARRDLRGRLQYNPFPGTAINGAIFDTVEKNRLASDPTNPLISIQTGQVRIRGVELEVITR